MQRRRISLRAGGCAALLLLQAAGAAPHPSSPPADPPAAPERASTVASRAAAATPAASSFDIGLVLGGQLAHSGLSSELAMDALVRGLRAALAGRMPSLTEVNEAVRYMNAARDALGERNHAAAREFLASNARQAGVTTTASGLEYQVLAAGDAQAAVPAPTDVVTIQYRGKLIDGTEIDSSYAHGRPATFQLNSVIKGWSEPVALMRPGARWRVWIPPALGYDLLAPPPVPPGSLLVYEIELIGVEPAPPGQQGAAVRGAPDAPGTAPAPPAPAR